MFAHVEPIFERNRPDFDHYSFVEIPNSGWRPILKELEDLQVFLALKPGDSEVCRRVGFLSAEDKDEFVTKFASNVEQLQTTVHELTVWIEKTLASHDSISVLGM